jgi:hypothetical protein
MEQSDSHSKFRFETVTGTQTVTSKCPRGSGVDLQKISKHKCFERDSQPSLGFQFSTRKRHRNSREIFSSRVRESNEERFWADYEYFFQPDSVRTNRLICSNAKCRPTSSKSVKSSERSRLPFGKPSVRVLSSFRFYECPCARRFPHPCLFERTSKKR